MHGAAAKNIGLQRVPENHSVRTPAPNITVRVISVPVCALGNIAESGCSDVSTHIWHVFRLEEFFHDGTIGI